MAIGWRQGEARSDSGVAIAIAKAANQPELVRRIEREINDAFDETPSRSPTPIETKKHAAAVNQKRNGQR